jgi:hypothetical protein
VVYRLVLGDLSVKSGLFFLSDFKGRWQFRPFEFLIHSGTLTTSLFGELQPALIGIGRLRATIIQRIDVGKIQTHFHTTALTDAHRKTRQQYDK